MEKKKWSPSAFFVEQTSFSSPVNHFKRPSTPAARNVLSDPRGLSRRKPGNREDREAGGGQPLIFTAAPAATEAAT